MCSDPDPLLTGPASCRPGLTGDFPQELLRLQYRTPAELVREAALLLERTFGGSAAVTWADAPPGDAVTAAAVSVPVAWAGSEQAVIRWHAPAAPGRPSREVIERAAQLGEVMSLRAEAALSRLQLHALTALREALTPGLPLAAAADATLDIAMNTLNADAGAVLCSTASGLKPLAVRSGSADRQDALATLRAAAGKVLAAGTALHDGCIVAAPFREQLPVRTILLLRPRQAPGQLATARAVLRKAVRLVPGAAAGSLFTRSGPDRDFECLSLPELPLAAPATGTVTAPELRAWYGAAADGWLLGLPRVIPRSGQAEKEHAPGSV